MEHLLSISSLLQTDPQGNKIWGNITGVTAETDLAASPLYPFPERFEGRLVGIPFEGKLIELTEQQLNHFRFDREVRVDFLGKLYKFKGLENNGTFEIVRVVTPNEAKRSLRSA
jgi:hypothetical protein